MNVILFALLAIGLQAAGAVAAETPVFKSDLDKINYGIGVEMARNFRKQGVELNLDMVVRGLKDGVNGEKLLIPEKELRKMMLSFQNELREKQAAARRAAALEHQKQPAR